MKIILGLLLLFSCITLAYGDTASAIAKGKTLSVTCVACHGPDGNSLNPLWPKIAGQNVNYFIAQILAFKGGQKGPRFNATMFPMVATLSDDDIENLADYYANQKITPGKANPTLVKSGERLYRGGNLKTHVSACIACHGPRGLGNPEAGFPALAGQYPEYMVAQLKAYKAGTRRTDPNEMMRDIAKRMTEKDMAAVASYISGLTSNTTS